MEKQSVRRPWVPLLQGGVSLVVCDLGLLMLLAALLVRGTLPERLAGGAQLACAVFSGCVGGWVSGRRGAWGTLPGALLGAACGTAILLLVGVAVYGLPSANAQNGATLAALLGGGAAGGLLAGTGGKRGRRKKTGRHPGASVGKRRGSIGKVHKFLKN